MPRYCEECTQWRVTENRRAFFENFAKKKNFDPLIPSNWYLVSYDEVVSEKVVLVNVTLPLFPSLSLFNFFLPVYIQGGSSIMNLFHSSLVAVLGDAFGFSLDSSEFRSMPSKSIPRSISSFNLLITIAKKLIFINRALLEEWGESEKVLHQPCGCQWNQPPES